MIFQGISLAILAAFYGCYVLKMLRQHQRGIQTDQIGKGKAGLAKSIEVAMKVATYAVLMAEVVSIFWAMPTFPTPARITGACLGAMGAAIFTASVLTMKDSWRAGVSKTDKTELVTGGIYQISRNPAFLGFDCVYIGILLMFFNWPLLSVSIFAMALLHLQIVYVEEPFLLQAFGDEYSRYREKVCRYIGKRR